MLVPFALVVFFVSVVMLASHKFAWMDDPISYTGVFLGAVCVGLGLHGLLRRLFGRDSDVVTSIAFALLVLGSGPFMAFHLENIPLLATVRITAPTEAFGSVQIGLLDVLQFAVIMTSACFAAVAMWRIRVRILKRGMARWGWSVVDALAAVYLLGALSLLFLGDSRI